MALTAFTSRLGADRAPRDVEGDGRRLRLCPRRCRARAPLRARARRPRRGHAADGPHRRDAGARALAVARARVDPPGLAWEASIIVDGTKLASMRAKPGRERLVTDLAANVSKLSACTPLGCGSSW